MDGIALRDVDIQAGMVYYPLFELMSREHGLTLLDSEMQEIIDVCLRINEKTRDKRSCFDIDPM